MKSLLLSLLFPLFLEVNNVFGQVENSPPTVVQPAATKLPATQAASTLPAVSPSSSPNLPAQTVVQQSNNNLYNQDQNTIESYKQIQVQSIVVTPEGTPKNSQTGIQAADVISPVSQPQQEVVQTNISTEARQQEGLATIIQQTLPITLEQAKSEEFPLFQSDAKGRSKVEQYVPRVRAITAERRITEKRVDLRVLTPNILWQKQILDNARSVAVVVEKDRLHAVTDSIYQLDIGLTLGQQFKLCPGTPFLDQPVIGLGTAFILNEQTMITANHVFIDNIDRYAIVFGFEMVNRAGAYEGLISLKDIYYPTRTIQSFEALDVAIFEVSRPLQRPLLKYAVNEPPAIYSPIYMIGHPYGLPKKVALNASIQSNGFEEYFYTSLFASQGNSGSPVFDLNTNQVIGVLVSGEIDYTWNGSCNSASVCRIPYCKGEKVISIVAVPGIKEFIGMD